MNTLESYSEIVNKPNPPSEETLVDDIAAMPVDDMINYIKAAKAYAAGNK